MRINLALALLAAACGGAPARPRDCDAYGAALRAPLARVARASDAFDATTPESGARSSRALAQTLDEERRHLADVSTGGGELDAGHRQLVAAAGEMAGALRALAATLEARDEQRREPARRDMRAAVDAWERAVARVRRACPNL
jgi:hypothetical protein